MSTHAQDVADAEPYTLDSRCTCSHRYPHHAGQAQCRICGCCGFVLADGPPVRARTGPGCAGCGQELLLTRPGRTVCERCRRDGVSPR